MEDFIFAPIVFALGLAIHFLVTRGSSRREANMLLLSFGAHVFSALLQVWLVVYYYSGGGDMVEYFDSGKTGAAALSADLPRFGPEVVLAFFQREYHLPIELFGSDSTLSMTAASAMLLFVFGNSLYAVAMFVGQCSYLSQYLSFRVLAGYFPEGMRHLVLLGTCLIPSGIFWSSALLKEPLVMIAIGPIMLGLHWLASGQRRVLAIGIVVCSSLVLVMLKPYVLMALSLAASVFYLWRRMQSRQNRQLKPFALLSAGAIAVLGLVLGSSYFTKGDTQNTADAFASQRRSGYEVEGGSNYRLDEVADNSTEHSVQQELLLVPLALGTALFRPLLFEARNAVQFVNGLEATAFLVLVVQTFRRLGFRRILSEVSSSPALLFCVVFTLALGLGTGLSSTNLGTLSRYRAPMMPFYLTVVLILRFGVKPLPSARSRLQPLRALPRT